MNGPDDIRRSLGRLALAMALLGIASVALGIGLLVLGLAGGAALALGGEWGGGAGLSALAIIVGIAAAAGGVPELLAWYGISKRAAWGRWLGIVLCTMMLAAFPLGTAFGAWGLWVLLSANALRAFGLQRSWMGDGAALLVGWFFMPGDDDRNWRVDRRGRRHRRGRHGGGGGLLLLLLIIGVMAFATCGSCASSFARGVSSGATSSGWGTSSPARGMGTDGSGSGTPSPPEGDATSWGSSWGAPAAAGAQAGGWLRDLGMLERGAPGSGTGPGSGVGGTGTGQEPTPSPGSAPPAPAPGAAPPEGTPPGTAAQDGPPPSTPPATSPGAGRGSGSLWTFEDAQGVVHIVDDVEKIPAARRHTARQQ